jgi:hypothetical protein
MYQLLDALEETLRAADPAKREYLAQTLDAYHDDFPDEFHWAIGAQSPALLTDVPYHGEQPTRDFDRWGGEPFHEQKSPKHYQQKNRIRGPHGGTSRRRNRVD